MRRLTDPALDPRGGRPRVRPLRAVGHDSTFFQYLGFQGPKWTITCGACGATFTGRIIPRRMGFIPDVDEPWLKCPTCDVLNVLPLPLDREED